MADTFPSCSATVTYFTEEGSLGVGELLQFTKFTRHLSSINRELKNKDPGRGERALGGQMQYADLSAKAERESGRYLMPFIHCLLFNDKSRYEIAFIPPDAFRPANCPDSSDWIHFVDWEDAKQQILGMEEPGLVFLRALSGHSANLSAHRK